MELGSAPKPPTSKSRTRAPVLCPTVPDGRHGVHNLLAPRFHSLRIPQGCPSLAASGFLGRSEVSSLSSEAGVDVGSAAPVVIRLVCSSKYYWAHVGGLKKAASGGIYVKV